VGCYPEIEGRHSSFERTEGTRGTPATALIDERKARALVVSRHIKIMQQRSQIRWFRLRTAAGGIVALFAATFLACAAGAQQASVSAWDAADFRTWSFVPYWVSQSQLNGFPGDGIYDHVSEA